MSITLSDEQDASALTAGMSVRATDSIARSANKIFVLVAVVGLVAFFGWAGSTSIEQVTKATGKVIPAVQNQNVQHMEGGIIAEILVHEGDQVQAGDPLVRVVNSFNVAELQQNQVDLAAETIRSARLAAESNGQSSFIPAADLASHYPQLVENESTCFAVAGRISTNSWRSSTSRPSSRSSRSESNRRG
jgi:multidrug efflux pump subunit AcrA (membrane-fusion protein)